jgi:hypothetical protein
MDKEAFIRVHSRYSRWDSFDAKLSDEFAEEMKHPVIRVLYGFTSPKLA